MYFLGRIPIRFNTYLIALHFVLDAQWLYTLGLILHFIQHILSLFPLCLEAQGLSILQVRSQSNPTHT